MEDNQIIELYWRRDERALYYTDKKYGAYCNTIAYRILSSHEDADECVNDTYFRAWNTIPPTRPARFSAFLGRITRNLAIDLRRRADTKKRGAGTYEAVLDELEYCLSSSSDPENTLLQKELTRHINLFLKGLPVPQRRVFIRRYWHLCSIPEIAQQYGYSTAKTRSMLYRTRNQLHSYLVEKGVLADET